MKFNSLNKTKWYTFVLFGLGEVILLVAGILIAIEIDKMVEAGERRDLEINSLREIYSSLSTTRDDLENSLEQDTRWQGYARSILTHLDQKKHYDPALDICFGSYYWSATVQLKKSAYEQLKVRGLDLISNDTLRYKISEVYDAQFDIVENEIEVWDSQLLTSTVYPLQIKLFRKYFPKEWVVYQDEYARPVDYESLLLNESFKNLLAEIISLRNYSIASYKTLDIELAECLVMIEKELDILEKNRQDSWF